MRRPHLFLAAAALLSLALPLGAGAAPASISVQPVVAIANGTVMGSAQLVRTQSGVSMTLHTTGLPAGEAVTIWWVVFNEPENCGSSRCGEPDLFNEAAKPSVQLAAGHVIGVGGTADFGGHLSVGDTGGAWPLFTGPGILDTGSAEIWLALHRHGPAIPGLVDFQLHSFGGGCANLPPFTGPNVCETTQVAIFQP